MTEEQSELQEKQRTGVLDNIVRNKKIFRSQNQVMHRLFRKTKKPYTLVDWHMRRQPSDLHLFAAFGLMNPLEYDYFSHHMDRWQHRIEDEEMTKTIPSPMMALDDDDDDEMDEKINSEASALGLPEKRVHIFLKSLVQEDYDQHENLCLRFEKPVKLIHAVDDALYLEGDRLDPEGSVSAVEELLCQNAYPVSEVSAWRYMNKMVARNSRSPLKIQLRNTDDALKKLNDFQLYKAVADICDYGKNPRGIQRINGQRQEYVFTDKSLRIQASLDFLQRKKFLNPEMLKQVQSLSDQERSKNMLELQRSAVSSFLTDMVQAAPDAVWFEEMQLKFKTYFHKLLETVGDPVLVRRNNVSVSCLMPKSAKTSSKIAQTIQNSFSENSDR